MVRAGLARTVATLNRGQQSHQPDTGIGRKLMPSWNEGTRFSRIKEPFEFFDTTGFAVNFAPHSQDFSRHFLSNCALRIRIGGLKNGHVLPKTQPTRRQKLPLRGSVRTVCVFCCADRPKTADEGFSGEDLSCPRPLRDATIGRVLERNCQQPTKCTGTVGRLSFLTLRLP